MTYDYRALGARIRATRKHHRLTQAQLAAKAGISTSFMGHIERGTRVPSIETLISIKEALSLSMDYLICNEGFSLGSKLAAPTEKMRALNEIMRILNAHDEWMRP